MFKRMQGASLVEWIVVVVIVIGVLGAAALTIANAAKTQADNAAADILLF